MQKKTLVFCSGCHNGFYKPNSEIVRMAKRDLKNHYCNNSCQAKFANNGKGNFLNFKGIPKIDEYSPYRYFLRKIRARHKQKNWETDLTLSFLKNLWESQNGICPITGWQMILPGSTTEWDRSPVSPNHASLDRIEAGKPYKIGNVRYISFIANMAKYTFKDEDVRRFAKAVVETGNAKC